MGMKGYGNCQLGQQSLIATPKELLQCNVVSWSKCLLVQISKTLICCAQLRPGAELERGHPARAKPVNNIYHVN